MGWDGRFFFAELELEGFGLWKGKEGGEGGERS